MPHRTLTSADERAESDPFVRNFVYNRLALEEDVRESLEVARLTRLTGIAFAVLFVVAVAPIALANTPPIASFEVHESDGGGATSIVLDASTSTDPDGAVVVYQWLYGDGSTGSGVTTTHTFPTASTYTVTLLVRDNAGASHLTSRTIDLSKPIAPPSAPVDSSTVNVVVPLDVPVGYRVSQRAPAFELPTFTGELVRLADFLGHVVLLEFWSSSCSACQASMPHLEELRAAFADRGLIVITLTVNRNTSGEWQYLLDHGFTEFIALREADPNGRPTMQAYNVSRIPHAVLIDPQGVIRYTGHLNLVQADMIEELL